jgi:hypothetical protein
MVFTLLLGCTAFFLPSIGTAQLVYKCANEDGTREFRNTGTTTGCLPVDASGIAEGKWRAVYADANVGVYVHQSSLARTGKYKKAWVMWNYAAGQKTVDHPVSAYQSAKWLEYFSCEERASANVQAIYYSGFAGTGDSVRSYKYTVGPTSFSEVVPDSVGDTVLNYICDDGKRRKLPKNPTASGRNETQSNSNGQPRLSAAELKARANGKLPTELSPAEIRKLGY